jgi:hypothetical protein
MNEVYELELWSCPGNLLPPEFGKELEETLKADLSLDEDIYLGASDVPLDTDTSNLLHALNERELMFDSFISFCENQDLVPSVSNNLSASKYLEYEYGRMLGWLHFPHNKNGLRAFQHLREWCRDNEFNIQCGQYLYCVNCYINRDPINW